jgi:hypothetical protein
VVFSIPVISRVEWECRALTAGKTVEEMFGNHWVDVLRFNRIDRRHANHTGSLKVPALLEEISQFTAHAARASFSTVSREIHPERGRDSHGNFCELVV